MVSTVPPHKYNDIIFGETLTLLPSNVSQLINQKYDKDNFSRTYNQCIGRGFSHEECRATLAVSRNITPQNPMHHVAQKEILDATQCMQHHKDIANCQKHADALFKKADDHLGFVRQKEFALEQVSLGIGAVGGDSTKLERFLDAVFNPVKYDDPTKLGISQKFWASGSNMLYLPAALIVLKFIKIK